MFSASSRHRPSATLGRRLIVVAGAIGSMLAARASAQPANTHTAPGVVSPAGESPADDPFIQVLSKDPNDPIVQAFARQQKIRHEKERELRVIRAKFFRDTRNTETRQIGIGKLREYTDPAIFPSLLEVFRHEDPDVRGAILDHLMDQATDEADTTLAWISVFDDDAWMREQAARRLLQRLVPDTGAKAPPAAGPAAPAGATQPTQAPRGPNDDDAQAPQVSPSVQTVIAHALRSRNNPVATAAANLSLRLNLVAAIPALIQAQVLPTTGTGGGDGGADDDSALAYILVGQQQAFVSDLTPVVSDSAVGFDPTLSVVTEGVVVRILDAVVITYRVEIHNALVQLSTRATGQSTAHLGYNQRAWAEWYRSEYLAAK